MVMQRLSSVRRLHTARSGWALIDVIIGGVILGIGLAAVALSLAPGVLLGLLASYNAWTLPGARAQSFLIISAITYLVALAGFSHSIVGSSEVFLLIFSGKASALALIAASLIPAILGNLLGGAGIFALLAHAQVRSDAEAK